MSRKLFKHKYIFRFILFHNKYTSSNKSFDIDISMNIVLLATSNFYNFRASLHPGASQSCACALFSPNRYILSILYKLHYCKGPYFTKQWPFIDLINYLINSRHILHTGGIMKILEELRLFVSSDGKINIHTQK